MDAKILHSKKVGEGEAKKKKIQLIILGGLILVLLFTAYSTFFGGKKKKPAPPPPTTTAAPVASASAPQVAVPAPSGNEGAEFVEADEWGNSPFSIDPIEEEAAEEVVVEKSKLELRGIVFQGDGGSIAMIDEKIVKKGDRIADNTVEDIQEEAVILRDDEGQKIVLNS